MPALPDYLEAVLYATQKWLLSGGVRVAGLRDPYFRAEERRKGSRARLANSLNGKYRRAEWRAEEHPLAEPLHFRWGNVCRLLADLRSQ